MSIHKDYGLNELHEAFLKFPEIKGHPRLPSFSLTLQNGISLLLVNSGMVPMKSWLTRKQEPPHHRVTTCQKYIRTGDIESIGHTARHGTYFKMLSNFFSDGYFKRNVIHWTWEFLTPPEWVGLEINRSYSFVLAGNEATFADDKAFRIWDEEIGIPAECILKFGKEGNFWEHGFGLCGPYSETYYDWDPEQGCGRPGYIVGYDCDRYTEVWNVASSQFDDDKQGHYTKFKQKNIDTGMGLEWLVCVCQNVTSLFDMDIVMNIINEVSKVTHVHYGETTTKDVSLRVITDHIRSSVFMTCNGVLPSNKDRDYVPRRPLCRAARHGKLLGVNEPFFYEVRDTVIHESKGYYPELRERQDYITKVIRTEKKNFAKTIDSDLRIFDDMLAGCKAKGKSIFSGADAFKLYDTCGFPIDLTLEMMEKQGMELNEAEFHNQMDEQRQRTRKAREALGDPGWAGVEFGKDIPETQFMGYDHTAIDDARVVALVMENEQAGELISGAETIMVLDKTPFYAEMDGQMVDHGIISADDATFQVTDVQRNRGGRYIYTGRLTQGVLRMGDTVSVFTNTKRHKAAMWAHSATRLLDVVLRQMLGGHVYQAGPLVEPDKLRFDFAHFATLTTKELFQVSALVNEAVLEGYEVGTEMLPIGGAKQRGTITLFGEKYGDTVRVVDMGQGFLVKFYGGTHLDSITKVDIFHIDSEFPVTSSVRRIEAATGLESLETMNRAQFLPFETAAVPKTKPIELREKAEWNMVKLREVHYTVEKSQAREAASETERFLMNGHDLGGLKVLTVILPNVDAAKLRQTGNMLRDRQPSMVAVLPAINNGRIIFLVVYGKKVVSKGVKVGDIIKSVATICGDKGSGKPGSAMGGGNDLLKLDDALAKVNNLVAKRLGL